MEVEKTNLSAQALTSPSNDDHLAHLRESWGGRIDRGINVAMGGWRELLVFDKVIRG